MYATYNNWLLWLAFRHRNQLRTHHHASPESWPSVTVQLPVYNEPRVIKRLLQAVSQLDYPKSKLQIQLLDDSADETTSIAAEQIEQMRNQGINVDHIIRNERTGYKAGALQEALPSASGELILILDADFAPEPDTLKRMVSWFNDPNVALVQGRWAELDRPQSLVERCTSYWIDRHFSIEQFARSHAGHFFHFNGSAGMWRKSAIVEAGGWSHETLAEDLDLSFRSWRKGGWLYIYDPEIAVPASNPADMRALKLQQGRWAEGAIQVARKVLPRLKGLPVWLQVATGLHVTGYLFPILLLLLSVMMGPVVWVLEYQNMHPVWSWVCAYLPSLGFLVGLSLQVLYRWYSRGPRAGILEIEAATVGLGLGPQVMMRTLRGLVRNHSEFERTPKGYGSQGKIDRVVLLEVVLAAVIFANALYAITHGQWLLVPLPLMAATGMAFSAMASVWPQLGAAPAATISTTTAAVQK